MSAAVCLYSTCPPLSQYQCLCFMWLLTKLREHSGTKDGRIETLNFVSLCSSFSELQAATFKKTKKQNTNNTFHMYFGHIGWKTGTTLFLHLLGQNGDFNVLYKTLNFTKLTY